MIYVLSDIHGNTRRFESVMEQIALREDDVLYVLGDVTDRGKDGVKLLGRLLNMPNARLLLGNHEHMMLECLDTIYGPDPEGAELRQRKFARWYRNGGRVTEESVKALDFTERRRIFDRLRALPLEYDVEAGGRRYKLVHGAPGEDYEKYGERYDDVLTFAVWMRWKADHVPDGDYTLVFGHTPTDEYQSDDPLALWYGERMIGIDCGCCYPDPPLPGERCGRLACLRLDDMRVFYSEEPNAPKQE